MNDMRIHLLFCGLSIAMCACTQNVPFGIGAPVLDSHFGEAVTRARVMQTINPEGVTVDDEGYSGKAAQNAMDKYGRGGTVAVQPQAMPFVPAFPTAGGTPSR